MEWRGAFELGLNYSILVKMGLTGRRKKTYSDLLAFKDLVDHLKSKAWIANSHLCVPLNFLDSSDMTVTTRAFQMRNLLCVYKVECEQDQLRCGEVFA